MRGTQLTLARRSSDLPGALVSWAAASSSFANVIEFLDRMDPGRRGLLPVLTYHRVGDAERDRLYPDLISATPAEFEAQMRYLAAHRYVASMAELLEVRRGGARLPARSVQITFDDGYRDFALHAWPILRRLKLAVTLFVPTAFPGRPGVSFWWDRLFAALSQTERRDALATGAGRISLATAEERQASFRILRDHVKTLHHERAMALVNEIVAKLGEPDQERSLLTWNELRELRRQGVTLAAHSRTHPMLDRAAPDELEDEVRGSLDDLEREIGPVPRVFAYPSGATTRNIERLLQNHGFEAAFTTRRGVNDLARVDWLRLRRINVGRRSTLTLIRAQLLSANAVRTVLDRAVPPLHANARVSSEPGSPRARVRLLPRSRAEQPRSRLPSRVLLATR